jgi:hypothetical protein
MNNQKPTKGRGGEPPKAPWGTEYYFCDVLWSWTIRCKWWLKLVPKVIVKFMNRNFSNHD